MSDTITPSTIARIAGNIAAGLVTLPQADIRLDQPTIALYAVELARAIVAKVEHTQSTTEGKP